MLKKWMQIASIDDADSILGLVDLEHRKDNLKLP